MHVVIHMHVCMHACMYVYTYIHSYAYVFESCKRVAFNHTKQEFIVATGTAAHGPGGLGPAQEHASAGAGVLLATLERPPSRRHRYACACLCTDPDVYVYVYRYRYIGIGIGFCIRGRSLEPPLF